MKVTMEKWLKRYFSEQWEDTNPDIDFSKYKPVSVSDSLHIHEERYEINGDKYRLLYAIGSNEPLIQILKK